MSSSAADIGRAVLRPRFLAAFSIITLLSLSAFHRDTISYGVGQVAPYGRNAGEALFSTTCEGFQHILGMIAQPPSADEHAPLNAAQRIARAEDIYQKNVEKRHSFLQQAGYGTDRFDPWVHSDERMPWWWYFQAAFNCPHEMERVGRYNDGGKWLCGMSVLERTKSPKCVIYSLGVFDDSSFEAEMMRRTNCEVWTFDASVNGVAGEAKGNPRIHFSKVFIGSEDKIDERGHVWKTLPTIMKELGHTWIDVLKVDIEGFEFMAMESLMESYEVLPFSQLQIELHLIGPSMGKENVYFTKFLEWFERLEKHQLRPFWSEINMIPTLLHPATTSVIMSEFSFINLAGDHRLLHD